MKNYPFVLFCMSLLFLFSCSNEIQPDIEKSAIRVVIENETNSFHQRNYDKQVASLCKDDFITALGFTSEEMFHYVGWDDLEASLRWIHENDPEPTLDLRKYDNYRIRLYPESAIAIYDELVYNDQGLLMKKYTCVRFLEKNANGWQIVFSSWADATSYDY